LRVLLFDANVLIDYFDAEPTVFASIRRSVGEIYVVSCILQEVEQLDALQAVELGLQVFEPDLELMNSAATSRGRLSFRDRLCLAVARSEGMTCVTNDTALRTHCTENSVEVLWGLELILLAVEAGGLLASEAREIGETICQLNPFIGEDVLARFLAKLR